MQRRAATATNLLGRFMPLGRSRLIASCDHKGVGCAQRHSLQIGKDEKVPSAAVSGAPVAKCRIEDRDMTTYRNRNWNWHGSDHDRGHRGEAIGTVTPAAEKLKAFKIERILRVDTHFRDL